MPTDPPAHTHTHKHILTDVHSHTYTFPQTCTASCVTEGGVPYYLDPVHHTTSMQFSCQTGGPGVSTTPSTAPTCSPSCMSWRISLIDLHSLILPPPTLPCLYVSARILSCMCALFPNRPISSFYRSIPLHTWCKLFIFSALCKHAHAHAHTHGHILTYIHDTSVTYPLHARTHPYTHTRSHPPCMYQQRAFCRLFAPGPTGHLGTALSTKSSRVGSRATTGASQGTGSTPSRSL